MGIFKSSNTPRSRRSVDTSGSDTDSKQYSFVALPGNTVKKHPRRRYIERLYQCSWPSCTKAFGTLNHLNAHVTMQRHGVKRSRNEFKELRKQWRKSNKEEVDARAAASATMARSSHHPITSTEDFLSPQLLNKLKRKAPSSPSDTSDSDKGTMTFVNPHDGAKSLQFLSKSEGKTSPKIGFTQSSSSSSPIKEVDKAILPSRSPQPRQVDIHHRKRSRNRTTQSCLNCHMSERKVQWPPLPTYLP
ncbi:hypothetical protein DFH29DRAFT_816703 [Suillus ampliporus]|nr:hypothetical protein DFH29DRAFT_816703 [Suillus ampliporus]